MTETMKRKALPMLLSLSMLVSGLFSFPVKGYGAEVVRNVTYYKFVIACVFIWGDTATGKWDPAPPGSQFTKQTGTTSLDLRATNIKIYQYEPGKFDLNQPNVQGFVDKEAFDYEYKGASVTKVTASTNGKITNGKLDYSWTAMLKANKPINAKQFIEKGEQQYIINLMGGLTPEMERFLQHKEGGFGPTIESWMYFVPYIIQYDVPEKVQLEDLSVQLDLPSVAVIGEKYTASDSSFIPSDGNVKSSVLQKNDGSGWKSVGGWDGKSVQESSAAEAEIDYRLTVTLTDGRSGSDTKHITIYDQGELPPDIEAEAILGLPAYTYEGHPVHAEDLSRFTVNGTPYSASRAYAEKAAANRFSIVQKDVGTITKSGDVQAKAIFNKEGNYNVQLRVTPKGGGALYDVKPIEVLKTPTVNALLGGVQKQNRKQVLYINVATHHNSPLQELKVEIEHRGTGEKVTLTHSGTGSGNKLQNSSLIKTRPIEMRDSDEFWTNVELPFLTKNSSDADFVYRISVRDSRGKADFYEEDFRVARDEPPVAKIEMAETFLRQRGSNEAVIAAEDLSETDGDQLERTWTVSTTPSASGTFGSYRPVPKEPGYQDNSFGAGQAIGFHKTGVGKFQLQLQVKDVWNEETLPEYITAADYLSDSVSKTAEVQNVAPVVSLKPIKARTAKILLLAGGEAEKEKLQKAVNEMQEIFLQKAVDAQIIVEQITPTASDYTSGTDQQPEYLWQNDERQGYQVNRGFFEEQNVLLDDQHVYRIDPTWKGYDLNYYPELPYTIRALDGKTGAQKWSYTLKSGTLRNPATNPLLGQDDTGTYLFFAAGSQTLVLNKRTGAQQTVLSMALGRYNAACQNNIYSFKEDGIYRISTSTGKATRIYSGTVQGEVRRIEGKMHFLALSGITLYRGVFDPVTEQTVFTKLRGNEKDPGNMYYTSMGIDTEGKILVKGTVSKDVLTVFAWDLNNNLVKRKQVDISHSNDYNYAATPVYDENGVSNYWALTYNTKTSSSKWQYTEIRLYSYYDDLERSGSHSNSSGGAPSVANQVPIAMQSGSQVYIMTGAYWVWIYNEGYGSSRHGYTERAKVRKINVSGGSSELTPSAFAAQMEAGEEYGHRSDTLFVSHYGDNSQYGGKNRIKAYAWKQNIGSILRRQVIRNLDEETDFSAVVIYDNANTVRNSSVSAIGTLLKNRNIELLYTTDLTSQTYGSKLATAAGGTVLPAAANLGAVVAEYLTKEKAEGSNTLFVKTQNSGDSIYKRFSLEPNTQYHYEYEVKSDWQNPSDIFSVKMEFDKPVDDSKLLGEKYVVVASHEEDFNDTDLNSFFNLNSTKAVSGIYSAVDFNKGSSGSSWAYRGDEHTISFNVPKGKKAVLAFDYDIKPGTTRTADSQSWITAACFIGKGTEGAVISGTGGQKKVTVTPNSEVLWEAFTPGTGTGHYTHNNLLGEGVNTVRLFATDYGRNSNTGHFKIDNLKVYIVEEKKTSSTTAFEKQTRSLSPLSNNWNHVSGVFTSPPSLFAFSRQEATYINGTFGKTNHTSRLSSTAGSAQVAISVPSGKAAVFAAITTTSNPMNNNGTRFTWKNYMWTRTVNDEYSLTSPYQMNLYDFSGYNTFTQGGTSSSQKNPPAGDFTHVRAVFAEPNVLTRGNRFFIDKERLFIENEAFSGFAAVSFVPTGQQSQIRNLKIYSIKNGKRVYITDEKFTDKSVLNHWLKTGKAQTAIERDQSAGDDEEHSMVYNKGELVAYGMSYYDYEADPSKRQFWKYTHLPHNDGPHPDAAVILNSSGSVQSAPGKILDKAIDRFYVDGKYIVEHWQEDDTSRGAGGDGAYDKLSNVERLTFYIQGAPAGSAPWITSIRTAPVTVKEGDRFYIQVDVDDAEKDTLSLLTEVYFNGVQIHSHSRANLKADAATGIYPTTNTTYIPDNAAAGKYDVVCTVRDATGTGIASYKFTVVSEGRVTGMVYHTDQWEENRKKYNQNNFSEEVNRVTPYDSYAKEAAPRKRGTNVFWSGEEFMLRAAAGGKPESVSVSIDGYPAYSTTLKNTGKTDANGDAVYEGKLWDKSMINKWGRTSPKLLTFRFRAKYAGGAEKIHEATVIVDSLTDYWLLHRLF